MAREDKVSLGLQVFHFPLPSKPFEEAKEPFTHEKDNGGKKPEKKRLGLEKNNLAKRREKT